MTTKIAVYEYTLDKNKVNFKRWSDKFDIVHIINSVIILRPGKYTIDFSSSTTPNVSLYISNEYGDLDNLVGTSNVFTLDLSIKTKYVIIPDGNNNRKHYMTITKEPEEIKIEDEYAVIES